MGAAASLSHNQIAKKLEDIPTLPSIVYELSQIISDPMSSTKDVEKIMANDQSLTAKVLKLVNSAYYAIPGGVSNLSRAIAYIGFDTVHQLVLSASIIQALEVKGPITFDINQFWKHSVGVGIASETIAKIVGHPMPADMFTCGLVHDMGKVALYTVDAESLNAICAKAKDKKLSFVEAEQALKTFQHTEIGKLLAERWALPIQIQAVIRYHHHKDHQTRGALSSDLNRTVDIVLLANLLIHALKFGWSGYEKISGAPKEVMDRLGISSTEGLKTITTEIKSNLAKADDFVRVLGS